MEGVEANAFQYMTGGIALVLGPTGFNLGAGMTGGVVYLLDPDESMLNGQYVRPAALGEDDVRLVRALLEEHVAETKSPTAEALLASFDPSRFARVSTCLSPASGVAYSTSRTSTYSTPLSADSTTSACG